MGVRIRRAFVSLVPDLRSWVWEQCCAVSMQFEAGEHCVGSGFAELGLTSRIQRGVFREVFSERCFQIRVFDALRLERRLREVFSDTCFRSVVTWLLHVSFS